MSIEIIRVDDRLIHGQVVVGWCPDINPDVLILCDDEVAESDWERQLYEDAAHEYKARILSTTELATLAKRGDFEAERCFLIVSTPKTIVKLTELGFLPEKVTIGGMHYAPGKRKLLDYLYVDDGDVNDFRALRKLNISLECRDLPNCTPINLSTLIDL